ncbi:hypothetical protein QEO77_gp55 [Arthrobacter phage Zaheer]|uniref:Uncharacterized protein n=1 Tax=Arthrobacter phage Zaheer TaxID=2836041 RepID=A0A8F3IQ36_9CAUD|nr:hypothetical protein QEO77_gp55 [Arthrobacter phage Zaheer]QWY84248.1 hypothetical protein SEA_ZAHEER_51 [Arthrobacter phage Zaheer]
MVEMIWKEPPPAVSSEKAAVLAELQKHPGRWALVQSRYKSSSAAAPWRKLGCEATHRRSESGEKGEYDVYARWPKKDGSEATEAKPEPAAAPATKVASVAKAVATGTALKPPPPAVPKAPKQEVRPVNDMGLTKFLEDRRKRGAVDRPE